MKSTSVPVRSPAPSSSMKPLPSRKKSPTRNRNPLTRITNLDVALCFLQENRDAFPEDLFSTLSSALTARDVGSLRLASQALGSPQLYENPSNYAVIAQFFALVTKVPYPFGGGDRERRAVALTKFYFSEAKCRRTTRRLRFYATHPDREDPIMRRVISRARTLIAGVLGSVEDSLPEILDSGRFGPGMTLCSDSITTTAPFYKLLQENPTVTVTARPYIDAAVARDPSWALSLGDVNWEARTVCVKWNIVESCRLTFVPKDERCFRTIAIEPYGNVWCQLGVHSFLSRRLKSQCGIDIHDQRPNQRYAKWSSENWLRVDTMSTLDLSSASDCVSIGLVERLVACPLWRGFLDDLRSKSYSIDGRTECFSKWSSMGNGYTFALETLLFWALAQACEDECGDAQALAYGDDILVSKGTSLLAIQTLKYCGFSLNQDKSFVTGPFRESCGADYHTGKAVRPVFTDLYQWTVSECYLLFNGLLDEGTFNTWSTLTLIRSAVQKPWQFYGPAEGSGDTHFFAPYWFARRQKGSLWFDGREQNFLLPRTLGTKYRSLRFIPTTREGCGGYPVLNLALRGGQAHTDHRSPHRWFNKLLTEGVRESVASSVVGFRNRGNFRVVSTSVPCYREPAVESYFFTLG